MAPAYRNAQRASARIQESGGEDEIEALKREPALIAACLQGAGKKARKG
jgi:hypothetical protein